MLIANCWALDLDRELMIFVSDYLQIVQNQNNSEETYQVVQETNLDNLITFNGNGAIEDRYSIDYYDELTYYFAYNFNESDYIGCVGVENNNLKFKTSSTQGIAGQEYLLKELIPVNTYKLNRVRQIANSDLVSVSFTETIEWEQSSTQTIRVNDITILFDLNTNSVVIELMNCQDVFQNSSQNFIGMGTTRIYNDNTVEETVKTIQFQLNPQFELIEQTIWTGFQDADVGSGRTNFFMFADASRYYYSYYDWENFGSQYFIVNEQNEISHSNFSNAHIEKMYPFKNEIGTFLLIFYHNQESNIRVLDIHNGVNFTHISTVALEQDLNLYQSHGRDRLYHYIPNYSALQIVNIGVDITSSTAPSMSAMMNIYPNPMLISKHRGRVASLQFTLPENGDVHFYLYNIRGQVVQKNYLGYFPSGENASHPDFSNLPVGTYIGVIKCCAKIIGSQKIVLLK
jgi:hypothetical protein